MTDSVFEQVLSVEDTPELLDFAVPGYGFLLWPYVRYAILLHCLERSSPGQYDDSVDTPVAKRYRYALFAKTILNTLRPWPKRSIWLYSHVGSAFYKQHNGRLYNSYEEPLAECLPKDTLLLDDSRGPALLPTVAAYALRRVQPITLLSRLARFRYSNRYQTLVEDFYACVGERVRSVLGFSLAPDFVRATSERLWSYTIPFVIAEYRLFSFFLKKESPRLLMIQDALYGGRGHLISLAKEHGTKVAEMQHGLVYRQHHAYSWAQGMRTSATLAWQIPDYFLTYGPYWNDKVRLPSQCQVQAIGNPWFAIQAAAQPAHSGTGILFALSCFYEEFAPIIQAVAQAFPDKQVIVRPHPSQIQIFYASSAAKIPGIHIDTNRDLYDTLSAVDTVIGEVSTSLFEAMALGKRVFSRISALTSELWDDAPCEQYGSAAELVEKLKHPTLEIPKESQKAIFGRNWEANYKNFVNDIS